MRDVFAAAATWLDEGKRFALATLVDVREAATAPLGTTIAVDDSGRIVGNIGAGCYEGEIVDAALRTLSDGKSRAIPINLTSDDELTGGSACGAMMEVVAWRPESTFAATAHAVAEGNDDVAFHLPYVDDSGERTFICRFPARDPLLLVGATSLASEIATIARRLDFHVTVIDPRPLFATRERLRDADAIVTEWPDEYLPCVLCERSAIVMLSHDPKFDLPALRCALRSNARYIGLLGSRRAQAARRASLCADGFDDAAIARIHGPVGLDIGGATTGETALSILAEIVAAEHARTGGSLQTISGPIHPVRQSIIR